MFSSCLVFHCSTMDEKSLGIIRNFSKPQLMLFLQKNGYSELQDVLNQEDIVDGETFLNLTELQVLKWSIPRVIKGRLLPFLAEIRTHPQKFVANYEEKPALSKKPSVRAARSEFQERLEQLILAPKPEESKPVRKPPAPLPESEDERPPSPAEDYLPMDQGIKDNGESHYDDNNYLVPIAQATDTLEENNYEAPPSTKIITNFAEAVPRPTDVSVRPPFTLPRNSTDERGYIAGPTKLVASNHQSPTLFPRVQGRPPLSTPVDIPLPRPPTPTHEDSDIEGVDYEQIDYGEDTVSNASSELTNPESQSGSVSRFFGSLIKKGKNTKNHEDNDTKANTWDSSDRKKVLRAHSPGARSYQSPSPILQSRALPLPPSPEAKFEEPGEEYENTNTRRQVRENVARSPVQLKLNVTGVSNKQKSKSDSDLATPTEPEEPSITYGNLDEAKKPPESYEQCIIKSSPTRRIALPLPPASLPQITLDRPLPALPAKADEDDDLEDYGQIITNLNNEPFFRNTDRKGARLLLQDLDDGAFLFRKSRKFFLTISLKYKGKYYNLGIERGSNHKIRLNTTGSNMSPEFATLGDLVEYFTMEQITFEHQGEIIETYLNTTLPPSRF